MNSILSKLASIRLLFWLLGLIVLACVIGAAIPQGESPEVYPKMLGPTGSRLVLGLGLDRLFSTAWFNLLLAALAVNLAACSLMRIRTIRSRPGVFVTHAAVLLILLGAAVRWMWADHGILPMRAGQVRGSFHLDETRTKNIPFQIRLDHFTIDRAGGVHLLHFSDHASGKSESLQVAGPGTYRLNPLDADVRVLAVFSHFMMGENGPANVSDQPVNPAVQLEIVKSGHAARRWLFAKFPDFGRHNATDASSHGPEKEMSCCATLQAVYEFRPGDIRQFRSHLSILENGRVAAQKTIHVNEPFRYKGYAFYQSGYDPNDPAFSSIQVAKDPSVPMVYAGFALLPLGLVWSFAGNPKSNIQNPKSR